MTKILSRAKLSEMFFCWKSFPRANPPAFTLIELLVVVTIIALLGITSFSGLSRLTEVQEGESAIRHISYSLDALDRSIENHTVVSYEAVFTSGSIGFFADIDRYKKTSPVEYSFNFFTGTGGARSTDTTALGMWELSLSAYSTSPQIYTLPFSGGVQTFSFPVSTKKRRLDISSGVGDVDLNSFVLEYYNLDNETSDREKEIYLTRIVWEDALVYNTLTVYNVLGKRSLLVGSGATVESLEKATLFFEKNGKEMQMIVWP